MKREDAFYYKNLIMLGIWDEYDEWLNGCLKTESPLSDLVLELSFCGSNADEVVRLLHNYCSEGEFDEATVADRLRLFFKDAYYSNRMTKDEVVSTMFRLALILDDEDFDVNLRWGFYYLDEYYSMTKDGIITLEEFDFAFSRFLDTGVLSNVDFNLQKPTLLDKIKSIFKKMI